MPVLIVIPARYGSTRYPGKPLVPLRGATGQTATLIERSYRAACAVQGIDAVVVATDDERIAEAARDFGADVMMTPAACRNGTERCAAVAERMPDFDLIVNLQGDAPLTPPWFIEALVDRLRSEGAVAVATPVLRCDKAALDGLLGDRRSGRVGGTTAVFNSAGRGLYFSKEVIPYTGRPLSDEEAIPIFHHIGVYAYRRAAVLAYVDLPVGPLELWEGLEQLRFLENGIPMACVEVESRGLAFWELNNPSDVQRIESILAAQGLV